MRPADNEIRLSGILADVQNGGQQRQAAGGLAAGTLQFVVEDGIFEGGQVEFGGVIDQPHADAVGEAVAEEAVG